MSSVARFRHEQLDLSKKQVRLIHHLSRQGGYISCCLQSFDLTGIPRKIHLEDRKSIKGYASTGDIGKQYSAVHDPESASFYSVSYEHESNRPKIDILVNDMLLPVSANLYDLLEELKNRRFQDYLFVDQISIDQESVEERNYHATLKQEIHSSTKGLLIWLGIPTESDQPHVQNIPLPLTKSTCEYRWPDVRDLLIRCCCNPHFVECSIIEKIKLASDYIIMWGQDIVANRDAILEIDQFTKQLPDQHTNLTSRAGWQLLSRLPLELPLSHWISKYHSNQCQDPRDRVYAFLDLIPYDQRKCIKVDYTKTEPEVFRDAAFAILSEYRQYRQSTPHEDVWRLEANIRLLGMHMVAAFSAWSMPAEDETVVEWSRISSDYWRLIEHGKEATELWPRFRDVLGIRSLG